MIALQMNWQWRLAALKNGFQDATAYRIEFLFEILGSAFVPAAIQSVLWYAMFKVAGAKLIAGMTYHQMLEYTFMSLLFSQIRGGDLDFELTEMIRTGQLSNYLVRPVGVVEFSYIRGIAPKLLIAGFCLIIGVIYESFLGVNPLRIIGAMSLALLGNVIHYQISAAIAASAFIWEEAFSMLMVKNMLVNFLSGELFPLTLIPASYAWVWKSAPFYLYVFGPTQYALGRWSDLEFFHNTLIACAWIVVGWLLIRLTWGLGIKRYLSLGG
jgi:ABC-2 type transport system permease protein